MANGVQGGRVKSADAVERRNVAAGTATEMQMLIGPDDGAPNFVMRRFCERRGFHVDRRWGGLVRFLREPEEAAD